MLQQPEHRPLVIGDTLYLVALREIGVSRAMPLSGTFPLSTLLFERLLLGTPLLPSLLAGSLLVGVGVVLLAWGRAPTPTVSAPPARLLRGILCALTASLLWGLAVTLLKPALVHLTMVQANAARMPVVALLLSPRAGYVTGTSIQVAGGVGRHV